MKSLIPSAVVLALGSLAMGCASPPVITKEIYQDRSMWIRLEKNPYGDKTPGVVRTEEETSITSGALAVWLKGFRVLTERGIIGMASGKAATDMAFVEPEILALAPHLAKGLALAKPDERVAYCFVADRNLEERYITTAFLYAQKPYLYYKLEEYRTLVKVHMSASTSQACQTKPQPGYKTADRYFRLEYSPEEFVVGYGLPEKFGSFMAGIVENRRGEVVFKLANLTAKPQKKIGTQLMPEPSLQTEVAQPVQPPAVQPIVAAQETSLTSTKTGAAPQRDSSNNGGQPPSSSAKKKKKQAVSSKPKDQIPGP
jgi:hypothetical protein